jgi:hypothetical protein
MALHNNYKINLFPFQRHSLHTTSHQFSDANFISYPCCETHIIFALLQSLYFFSHSPKKHLEFLKLVDLMKAKGSKILQNVKTE